MKLNISKKLLLGFFSILLLLLIVSVLSFVEFTIVNDNYSSSIDESFNQINLVTDMENAVLREVIVVRGYLANGNKDNLSVLNNSSELFNTKAEELLKTNSTNEENNIIDEFISVKEQYNLLAQELIELKEQNNTSEITKIMAERGNALTTSITDVGEKARFYQESKLKETSNELSKKVDGSKTIIIIISVIAFFLGILIALYISRMISKPVQQISKSAESVARGDLTIDQIKIKNRDEIGALALSFNQMTKNLRELILNVSTTSERVASSAEELMASAEQTTSATNQVTNAIQEVASGSEFQGKATKESAKSISEMSIGINRIADTSSSIAGSSADTTSQAIAGNELLQKVVRQMKSINDSTTETNKVINKLNINSNQIGKIIEVITGIADQTNLLALNAAIESARAGEHGKGFAVVADEVRKLAEQSRSSASQISNLVQYIQADVLKVVEMVDHETAEVSEGMNLVEQTGTAFSKILSSIKSVSGEIQELSVVSEQMSASMERVNASIEDVSKIAISSIENTADIASSSEEQLATMEGVTSSASNLANMAEDLRGLIGAFKI
ncbi:methyl-accepting chemotaxis protein [Niallia sp. 03133]|uniref:methyl-accepting chemotaxis protein n=1 Tax=Niallia sp. 03133 TaxID=3458060 RepID=UPI0040449FD2